MNLALIRLRAADIIAFVASLMTNYHSDISGALWVGVKPEQHLLFLLASHKLLTRGVARGWTGWTMIQMAPSLFLVYHMSNCVGQTIKLMCVP